MIPASLAFFVFVGLFSPGPNVILLTASGARFGFRATVPHILGVAIGVGITAGLTGLGLGAAIMAVPMLTVVLKGMAMMWILHLAHSLYRATRAPRAQSAQRPFTFVQAVLFQWVNPKVWAVALAASSFVADQGPVGAGLALALAFSAINLGVCLFWTSAGHLLGRLLADEALWRVFMTVMSGAMALSAVLVLL
ncbi:LysE family translocator [Pontivivens nitratireducens]|uniref:LysE family transporter n=1 Tax=Pontivivens nitratireducens TaxID=2758038 RepID=A0A6G7VJI2_9RHOB|nr:LysE family transporter [Pontibrevibacter nitratireducens]QIK40025.1 LysE family transporter [Pontibrevibacter nitratireducens]